MYDLFSLGQLFWRILERNNKVVHDKVNTFMALLNTCIKNKDLYKIHNYILSLGLLETRLDALEDHV